MKKEFAAKVLFVDDEPDVHATFGNIFPNNKHNIINVLDFKTAEQILKNKRDNIGLIIADYKIPNDIDGLEFLKKCAKIDPQILRILTTGFSEHKIAIEAVNSGILYRYILKPWNRDDIFQTVINSLNYHIIKLQKNLLLNSYMSTLRRLILTDTLGNMATASFILSNHINNSIAAFKKFEELLPNDILSESFDISLKELRNLVTIQKTRRGFDFKEILETIKNTVVTKSPKFMKVNLADILKDELEDFEIPENLERRLYDTEESLFDIKGDKQILTQLIREIIDHFIDIKAKKLSVKTEKTLLFGETQGVKISFIGEEPENKTPNANIITMLPIIFAVYHHSGQIDFEKFRINIYLPIHPGSVKNKFDNDTDGFGSLFTKIGNIKYYETWISILTDIENGKIDKILKDYF